MVNDSERARILFSILNRITLQNTNTFFFFFLFFFTYVIRRLRGDCLSRVPRLAEKERRELI